MQRSQRNKENIPDIVDKLVASATNILIDLYDF